MTTTQQPPNRQGPVDTTVGTELPALEIAVTRSLIVATALASRDYQDVHHDPALAAEKGSPDIFMNILTTNALVERFVREWAGPAARLVALKVRLGVPNYPGDTMVLHGSVSATDGDRVEITFSGDNARGPHASGTATLSFAGVVS